MFGFLKKVLASVAIVAYAVTFVQPKAGATDDAISFGVPYEYKTLNPLYMSGSDRIAVGTLVYSTLLGANPEGDLMPKVAAIVPSQQNGGISADGLTITYHLRHDVKWADGTALTSRDVVFTHEADMNPKNTVIETYGDKEIASIAAPDAYTVVVHLKRRFSPFIEYVNRPRLPAHLLDKYESLDKVDYNSHPIGSGPYQLGEWARGDHVTFVKSPTYWGRPAHVVKITLRTIPDANTLALQLRSHGIDAAVFVDPTQESTLAGDPQLRLTKTVIPSFGLIIYNASNQILSDVRVRRAFAMAFNRAQIVDKATQHFADAAHPERGLLGWGYDPSVKPVSFDQAGARKLLDEAGWAPGPDGIRARGAQKLELVLATNGGHPFIISEAEQIVQQAREVGFLLDLKSYVDQQMFLLTKDGILWGGKFDLALTQFNGGGDPDPDWLIGCDATGKPNPYNFSHMCIPKLAPVLQDAVSTFDRAQRKRDYTLVQRAIDEWLPVDLLYQSVFLGVVPKRLRNYVPSPYEFGAGYWNVTDWSY